VPLSTHVVYKGEPKLTRKPIRQPKQQEKNKHKVPRNKPQKPPRHTTLHHMGCAFPTPRRSFRVAIILFFL